MTYRGMLGGSCNGNKTRENSCNFIFLNFKYDSDYKYYTVVKIIIIIISIIIIIIVIIFVIINDIIIIIKLLLLLHYYYYYYCYCYYEQHSHEYVTYELNCIQLKCFLAVVQWASTASGDLNRGMWLVADKILLQREEFSAL